MNLCRSSQLVVIIVKTTSNQLQYTSIKHIVILDILYLKNSLQSHVDKFGDNFSVSLCNG